jgi:transcriptional regulator with XRE-family HTH domain
MSDDFASGLRELLDERGVSQGALARRIPCDRALICRYARGKQQPSAKMASRIDEILDAGGRLMALAGPRRRAVLAGIAAAAAGPTLFGALDERDRLAWTERHPSRIDTAVVASLADALAAQRRTDDALGSAAMIKPVMAQLAVVENLATEARGPVRHAVIDVAMQWCQFAAWLHLSARDFPTARALWRQTLELATEAGDATMTTTVLHNRAYMAYLAGEPGPLVGLASAAQRDLSANASERALGAALEARGHAMTGDGDATERALGAALDMAGQRQPGRWSYWATPQYLDCERGVALGYLAHIDRYRAQAFDALTAGYQSLGADLSGSEWGAMYLLHRAAVHVRGGDVGEACADAMQAIPVARQTNSASLAGMLAQLHAGLSARYPRDPRVAELAEALA